MTGIDDAVKWIEEIAEPQDEKLAVPASDSYDIPPKAVRRLEGKMPADRVRDAKPGEAIFVWPQSASAQAEDRAYLVDGDSWFLREGGSVGVDPASPGGDMAAVATRDPDGKVTALTNVRPGDFVEIACNNLPADWQKAYEQAAQQHQRHLQEQIAVDLFNKAFADWKCVYGSEADEGVTESPTIRFKDGTPERIGGPEPAEPKRTFPARALNADSHTTDWRTALHGQEES